jgi:hypothetical protein
MKKITTITFLAILSLLLACACAAKPAASTSATTVAPPAETTFLTGAFSEKDLVYSYNGTDVTLLSDVQPLLKAIGEGYSVTAAPSCMFTGEDKRFTYPAFDIFTYPIDGQDQIDEIVVTDTGYKTARGISVGDTYDSVVAAYGDGSFDDVVLTYLDPDEDPEKSPRLIFGIDEGVVTYISYYSARNMW